jgi:hypothetical protein
VRKCIDAKDANVDEITGKTLLAWGYKPGSWFAAAIAAAEEARRAGGGEAEIRAAIGRHIPAPAATLRAAGALAHRLNIAPEDADEIGNVAAVEQHMVELMRVPTVRAGAVMPDACPAGAAPGTIPVGGVVAAENAIHPGMHSADICCSLAVSVFRDLEPTAALDAGMRLSHFGGGGRPRGEQLRPHAEILSAFESNPFLKDRVSEAIEHFATQGDGNHFFFVGRVKSTGDIALVTHHGSRKPGALLYKAGMAAAENSGSAFRRRPRGTTRGFRRTPARARPTGRRCRRSVRGPRRTTSQFTIASARRSAARSRTGSGTSTISFSGSRTACSITPKARRRRGPILRPTAAA